ncbi:MAG: 2-dehydro-3-deoxy-6-phosphogalactonate aldolase [Psychrosphaera sp.]|nr:2-dehydro-3-deoxy-6-phosphogalactonate aldolase [Psychrosphaera sp.]
MLNSYLDRCPLVAILRGIEPRQCIRVADVLLEAGFTTLEVPLNSPDALPSIRLLKDHFGHSALIGAGTVIRVEQVMAVYQAGARLVFSPNCDIDIIKTAKTLDMVSIPGCATPTEAFAAIDAGADLLKLFPAQLLTPNVVKSMVEVLPSIGLLGVGGISADNMKDYLDAGCTGFGLGGALFKPGKSIANIKTDANRLMQAFLAAKEVECEAV